mmetsp:Transcript_37168/g.72072  ORF Transcript_37168/g.72072 Transcript_37168/m.72072 type:complete len:318 (+) Transcript_37168:285-1238(+)
MGGCRRVRQGADVTHPSTVGQRGRCGRSRRPWVAAAAAAARGRSCGGGWSRSDSSSRCGHGWVLVVACVGLSEGSHGNVPFQLVADGLRANASMDGHQVVPEVGFLPKFLRAKATVVRPDATVDQRVSVESVFASKHLSTHGAVVCLEFFPAGLLLGLSDRRLRLPLCLGVIASFFQYDSPLKLSLHHRESPSFSFGCLSIRSDRSTPGVSVRLLGPFNEKSLCWCCAAISCDSSRISLLVHRNVTFVFSICLGSVSCLTRTTREAARAYVAIGGLWCGGCTRVGSSDRKRRGRDAPSHLVVPYEIVPRSLACVLDK